MLDQCTIEERWSGVNELIERWLQERQSLIVEYCALSGVHLHTPESSNAGLRLEKFCELLVDYVSAGHFEVYDQLIREAEAFDDGSEDEGKKLLPRIHASTEIALDFNDCYTGEETKLPLSNLPKDLSKLGETIATRFEFEDRLIEVMHTAHREQVA